MIERTPETFEPQDRAGTHFFIKKRLVRWVLLGLGAFVGLTMACLLLVPQSYKARLSLSLASATGATGNGLLAGISGMGSSPNTKYVGVLRSRGFAEEVADRIGLQRLYHQKSRQDAVEALQESVIVADNPKDSLLYVDVSLYGPPRLAFNAGAQKDAIRSASAQAANLYTELLRRYIATEDIDSDGILLKGAAEQLATARGDYDRSVARLAEFVRTHSGQASTMSLSQKDAKTPDGEAMAKDLASLYTAQATLESDILATEAAQRIGEKMQADQLQNLSLLPTEDPLLTQARASVMLVRTALDNERVLLGPDHPTVVAEQARLKLAEEKLQQQIRSVQRGLTTVKVNSQVKMQEMKTRYQTLSRQIEDTERKAQTGREVAMQLEQRRSEVVLRMDVLKAVWTQTATLSLQVVSAKNRIKVVDSAMAPRKGSPNLSMFAFLCALVTATLIAVLIHVEYRAFLRSQPRLRPALTVTGS